jgi:aldehyde:ferredoxin oxidoreductase
MAGGHDPQYESQGNDTPDAESHPVSPGLEMLGLTTPTPPRSLGSEKIRFMRITQDFASALDSVGFCAFVAGTMGGLFNPDEMPKIINYVTGWDMTLEEFVQVGERKINMMRLFNARDGYDMKNDQLPDRMFEPMKGGVTEGLKLDRKEWKKAKVELYRQRGWNENTGNPDKEKISQLGLDWAL